MSLKATPTPARLRVGVAGIGEDGIEHGHGVRQRLAGTVVVGDDDVDAFFLGFGREFHGLDAAVDADDQAGAFLDRDLDVFVLDAVAVGQPFRDEVLDRCAEGPQGFHEHDGRQDPVNVVIAEDEDLFALGDGRFDPGHGPVHAFHQVRVMQG